MRFSFKHRKHIQYSLVVITLLLQVIILIFFYNEFFNEKKLDDIKTQIEETKQLKKLTRDSKRELFDAQNHLKDYIENTKKESIVAYFQSLKNVTNKIDSLRIQSESLKPFDSDSTYLTQKKELKNLKNIVDSLYEYSPQQNTHQALPKIKSFDIENHAPTIKFDEKHILDSTPKKKFFPRLKDAFLGTVPVKTDTIYISTKMNREIDTSEIKKALDSTVSLVNKHYQNEVQNYQTTIQSVHSNSHRIYNVYQNLILLSNTLIDVYDVTYDELDNKLEAQYTERYSINNKIRRYSVFGLMLLLFLVLIIMAYFIKISFTYEKELKEANKNIHDNLKFKNRILGMLSHEIRAPLKIITIFINRITQRTTDENILASLKSIRFTNDSLLIQAGQILEYTKNQNTKDQLNLTQWNLKQEIVALLEVFEPYFQTVNNSLEVQNELPDELIVLADKAKIHQIFINLLGNANKFTENGKITVNLKISNLENNQVLLFASITDTGIGISENDLEKIFEPYYQGTIEMENLGVGLGLNLCKEIIEALQGEISISSKKHEGTSIHFQIKLTTNEHN